MLLVFANEQSQYKSKCSLCILNGFQYCNKLCQDIGDQCDLGSSTNLQSCASQIPTANSTSNRCNRQYNITVDDYFNNVTISVPLFPGQYCLIAIADQINKTKASQQIAWWNATEDNTATLLRKEIANETVLFDWNLTTNYVDITTFETPFDTENKLLTNFTQLILAYNPNTDSEVTYHVSGAKALIGAAFIQYLFYGIMYIIEGFKLKEFDENATASTVKQRSPVKQNKPEVTEEEHKQSDQEMNDEGRPTDLREIALEDSKGDQTEPQHQQQLDHTDDASAGQTKAPSAIKDPATEDEDDYEFENMHFLPLFVKNYQKGTIWFMLILAFACLRGAVGFVIAFGYIQLLFRVIQFVGTIFKKRVLSRIGYIGATTCIVIMFFGVMIDERHAGTF